MSNPKDDLPAKTAEPDLPHRGAYHRILGRRGFKDPHASSPDCADWLYRLSDINEIPGIELIELVPDKIYAAKLCPDEVNIHFALFEWATEDDNTVHAKPFWFGSGTGGSLRELRHSYFGHDGLGYIFYADLQGLIEGAKWLKTMFDGD